ncbi:hypothetical protein [Priestia megaterium]|uniref:hypothetical protein n=1 Tax=Priestia TaxID=2800373 RepID=UPI00301E5D47
MKKSLQLFGTILFISGIILFGLMHLAIALYIPHLEEWSDPPGKLAVVLNEIIGWIPYVLSILFMLLGGSMLIFDLWKSNHKEQVDKKS